MLAIEWHIRREIGIVFDLFRAVLRENYVEEWEETLDIKRAFDKIVTLL